MRKLSPVIMAALLIAVAAPAYADTDVAGMLDGWAAVPTSAAKLLWGGAYVFGAMFAIGGIASLYKWNKDRQKGGGQENPTGGAIAFLLGCVLIALPLAMGAGIKQTFGTSSGVLSPSGGIPSIR